MGLLSSCAAPHPVCLTLTLRTPALAQAADSEVMDRVELLEPTLVQL